MTERPIEDIGPDSITPQDWFVEPRLAWWLCRCQAVKEARALVEHAQLAYETQQDIRLSLSGAGATFEAVDDARQWLRADCDDLVDLRDER